MTLHSHSNYVLRHIENRPLCIPNNNTEETEKENERERDEEKQKNKVKRVNCVICHQQNVDGLEFGSLLKIDSSQSHKIHTQYWKCLL